MRYPASEKAEIIRLVEQSHLPVKQTLAKLGIIAELKEFGIAALVHDPMANAHGEQEEYGLTLTPLSEFRALDAIILAVSHADYMKDIPSILGMVASGGVIVDIKSVLSPSAVPAGLTYWSL